LTKDFLQSKVHTNLFVQAFVHTDPELDEILVAAQNVPEGEFYKKAFSCTDKLILSPGQAERGETTGSKIVFSLSRLFFLICSEWIPAFF
jgi:hypothetical protein